MSCLILTDEERKKRKSKAAAEYYKIKSIERQAYSAQWRKKNLDKLKLSFAKWASKNKDHLSNYRKDYRAKNQKRIKEYVASYSKSYYLKNKEALAKYNLEYREKNADKLAAKSTIWRAANLPKLVANNQKRRARIANLDAGEERLIAAWRSEFSKRKARCYWCGGAFSGKKCHMDHIIPISRGEKHSITNLCISCPSCNCGKKDKNLNDWNAKLAEPVLF